MLNSSATLDRVFRAFADRDARARWFGCVDGWAVLEHALDFRVGGREVWRGGPPGGAVHRNDTRVPRHRARRARIVWSYAMSPAERRISVSLASVELHADGAGTQFVLAQSGVFLDGYDDGCERRRGTDVLLANLARFLDPSESPAP